MEGQEKHTWEILRVLFVVANMTQEQIDALAEYCSYPDPCIYGFFNEFRFLSNFHEVEFEYDGMMWKSSEHAYMAAKTIDPIEKLHIQKQATPRLAKREGGRVTLKKNWDNIKYGIMKEILEQKFKPGSHLGLMLQATAPATLVEANWWGDRYWGECKGTGANNLGKILMEIRDNA